MLRKHQNKINNYLRSISRGLFFLLITISIIISFGVTWLFLSFSQPHDKYSYCNGKGRWHVKTLTDSSASKVNYTPSNITIAALRSIALPLKINDKTQRFGVEFKTYSVHCQIKEFKINGDGDYHLILTDLTDASSTMIGEIPDSHCPSIQKSFRLNDLIKVRKDFENLLLTYKKPDSSVYIITGVAFFDKLHGQPYTAPTGIEMHPILSISKQ